MEKYENLGLVGEGSYGMVTKCRHKQTGQTVAIKKFLESEDDKMVKKIAMREVKMLRKLRHENLVNLIEVFRRRKRLYLVFEFVDHTILDDLEKYPKGLSESAVQKILWQVLRAVGFIHSHNIIHRDIKPENILHSRGGTIKLCDFGFARTLASSPGESYTDYVATRWYRAPELLVGDTKYGRAVDVWAIGCLVVEMMTGDPLFPGDSDIDQLYQIIRCFGNICPRHRDVFYRNPLFAGMRLPDIREFQSLEKRFCRFSNQVVHLMKKCMEVDPNDRPSASSLLSHNFFQRHHFTEKILPELRRQIQKENQINNTGFGTRRSAESNHHERITRKKLTPKEVSTKSSTILTEEHNKDKTKQENKFPPTENNNNKDNNKDKQQQMRSSPQQQQQKQKTQQQVNKPKTQQQQRQQYKPVENRLMVSPHHLPSLVRHQDHDVTTPRQRQFPFMTSSSSSGSVVTSWGRHGDAKIPPITSHHEMIITPQVSIFPSQIKNHTISSNDPLFVRSSNEKLKKQTTQQRKKADYGGTPQNTTSDFVDKNLIEKFSRINQATNQQENTSSVQQQQQQPCDVTMKASVTSKHNSKNQHQQAESPRIHQLHNDDVTTSKHDDVIAP